MKTSQTFRRLWLTISNSFCTFTVQVWQPSARGCHLSTASPADCWLTPVLLAGLVSLSSFVWLVIFGWTLDFFESTLHYIFHSSMHHTHWWWYWLFDFILVKFCLINLLFKLGTVSLSLSLPSPELWLTGVTSGLFKFNSLQLYSVNHIRLCCRVWVYRLPLTLPDTGAEKNGPLPDIKY